VFEKQGAMRIFVLNGEEITSGCRKLRNGKVHNLDFLPSIRIFKLRIEMGRAYSMQGSGEK
jgi:hypothetical protein